MEECHVKLDCDSLRKALEWASQRQTELAQQFADGKCTPPEGGCFITTACCEMLGLDDDCFELRALRRYRDQVLAALPGGDIEIARYYALAPLILARLPEEMREARLILLYARFVLPAALAAHVGLDHSLIVCIEACSMSSRATSPPIAATDDEPARRISPRPLFRNSDDRSGHRGQRPR